MAQVQQVSTLNGSIPEKNGNGLSSSSMEESSGLTHIQNGAVLLHGTPTKDLNGASTSLETVDDLQLSPGDLRRRSTRASALKAQEKIKLKDDIVQGPQQRSGEEETEEVADEVSEEGKPKSKKRKLENGGEFDQTCFRFGLRANEDGEVYAMTDESENSSIHDSEMEIVRYHYEKMKNREPDEEQLRERLKMRKEAENALREEEAKLLVLRKMKDSQNRAITKSPFFQLAAETKAADLAEAAAAAANAYKPVMANPSKGAANNGKSSTAAAAAAVSSNKQVLAGLANLTIQQQLDLLQKLSGQSAAAKQAYLLAKKNPAQTTQLFAQLIAINNAQIAQQKQKETEVVDLVKHQPQTHATQSKVANQQTPAQRAQAARMAFRQQADKQLMTIPTHKVQPHDITFVPNPNASAFLALHGLDQVVQHVLKDKTNEKPYDGPPYECEECKTDCAPTWKAIGSSQDDLHLYCESCVRSAQKRKNRTDQTNLLKRAFQKISSQEKDFEKKIAEGQLEQFVDSKPASSTSVSQNTPTSSTATVSSTPLPTHRLSNIPSSSGTSTPTPHKSSTPQSSTPKASSSSSKKAMANNQQQLLAIQQIMANSMRNPAMMQQGFAQMMQMYQMAQVQAATQQSGMGNMANLFMQAAQAQVAQAAQAQINAQAAQARAQQQAAQEKAKREREQQQQQQAQQQAQQQQHMLMALLAQSKMSPQLMQSLSTMTPAQQKQFVESVKNAIKTPK
uniref:Transcriptional repressor p66 coiled-coil MBD2-interaction domain-containing protein n=1 Tax=Caenorhabditis japonica TaxID=281687 RepID=A0A8R1DY99_CAEJA